MDSARSDIAGSRSSVVWEDEDEEQEEEEIEQEEEEEQVGLCGPSRVSVSPSLLGTIRSNKAENLR